MAQVHSLSRDIFFPIFLHGRIKVNWHLFGTSHGKGMIDGIGGTVKRTVWCAVRSGNA